MFYAKCYSGEHRFSIDPSYPVESWKVFKYETKAVGGMYSGQTALIKQPANDAF